jgi:hypothetical protein
MRCRKPSGKQCNEKELTDLSLADTPMESADSGSMMHGCVTKCNVSRYRPEVIDFRAGRIFDYRQPDGAWVGPMDVAAVVSSVTDDLIPARQVNR